MVTEMTTVSDKVSDKVASTSQPKNESIDPASEWDARWQAVQTRDRRFDGEFVYAVRSTGIYCRCTCPSRRPNRRQVRFFSGPEPASQAGFRACRRCRPEKSLPVDQQMALVRTACRHIQEADDGPPTLTELSASLKVSPGHLQRVFKRLLGVTPRQFADACRQDRFKARLKSGWDITDAMYDAGYGSSSRLYEGSLDNLGMSPASYKRGGGGARIAYATVDSPLGQLLVAATPQGICAVKIGDHHKDLEDELRGEFPGAELHQDNPALGEWVTAIVEHLSGKLPSLDLPVDVRATAFQRQVWEYLRTIPYGETRTYQQIATELGQPRAARAVGRACATNPVAVVVPCHRVVRRDGNLGGYRWGLHRKKALLAQERAPKDGLRTKLNDPPSH